MNDSFARFIQKRWYLVVIVWIVMILLSIPFISLFFSSVSYQIAISIPGSTAARAENIVSNYFNLSGTSESGAVVVIQGNVSKDAVFLSKLTSFNNLSVLSYYTLERSIISSYISSAYPAYVNLTKIMDNISVQEIKLLSNLTAEQKKLNSTIEKTQNLSLSVKKVEKSFIDVKENITNTTQKLELLKGYMDENISSFSRIKTSEENVNSSAHELSLFLNYYPFLFLDYWESVYNSTHNVTLANQYAYEKVVSLINSTKELNYFNLFYHEWNSSTVVNPLKRAQGSILSSISVMEEEGVFNSTQSNFISSLEEYVNLTNFREVFPYYLFAINYLNVTYRLPLTILAPLFNTTPLSFTLEIYSQKTGISEPILYYLMQTGNAFNASYEIVYDKAPQNYKPFIHEVFLNINETPYAFSTSYVYQITNESIPLNLIREVGNLSQGQVVQYIINQTSAEEKLPTWFFSSLLQGEERNLTAYLISQKLTFLSSILSKSNMTSKELAELLFNTSPSYISSILLSNYVNVSPILQLNRGELREVLVNNMTNISTIISKGYFFVEPISNISNALYLREYYLVLLKGNVTYSQAENFANYLSSKLHSKVILTGSEPVSHSLKGLATSAFSIAIPVGIILAILLTGIYFRSFVAAFVPLGIYFSAFTIASVLIWGVVIKILGITVDFLTPSQVLLLALGLGTDYVVFISGRYIEERRKGKGKDDASREAIKWGGKAVTITALVVMLSFFFLYVYNIPFFSDTAIAEMLAVVVVWFSAITFFSAILSRVGDKLFFPYKIKQNPPKERKINYPGLKAGIILTAVVIFAAVAMTTQLSFNVLGLLPQNEATEGVNLLSSQFTTANVFPICVVIPVHGFNYSTYQHLVTIYKEIQGINGVTSVQSSVSPYGGLI
ncbi:MMPL family transporter, partial [Acidianus sp. RZ1]|uniref:MMPL family transporter n=1 Tax=Acidianus sp. RZ1 TaxID=1540082 RepID=UPI001490D874